MQSAIEHLKTRFHKHQSLCGVGVNGRARRYVMENCKEESRVKEAKKDTLERKQKWCGLVAPG